MDDNNMDTQAAPEAEKETQGLMGQVPSNDEPVVDVAETSVPHLVQNEEVGSDEDALYEKPEWFPDKHWDEKEGPDLEGLVKSNKELEKAFHRGDHKVPEEYKLDVLSEFDVPADDELLSGFVTWAKENNVNQKGFDDLVTKYLGHVQPFMQQEVVKEQELKSLGPNANEIITANTDWINGLARKGVISEEDQRELYFLGDVAAGQRVISKLRQMSGDMTPIPTSPIPQGKMSQQEFKEHAQVLMQDPKYGTDPVYTRNVEKEFNEYYGT